MTTVDFFKRKFDSGKSRVDLIPSFSLIEVGKILAYGAEKYAEDSWQEVPEGRKRYTAALLRHVYAWQNGEDVDPETGYHHLSHAATNCLFLVYLVVRPK